MRSKFIGTRQWRVPLQWTFFAPYWFCTVFFLSFKCIWWISFFFCHLFWLWYDDYPFLMHRFVFIFIIFIFFFLLVLDVFQVTVEKVKNSMLMFIVNTYLVYMSPIIWHHLKMKIPIFMLNNSHVLWKRELNQLRYNIFEFFAKMIHFFLF